MSQDWLVSLEEKIQQTTERLRGLQDENQQLEARNKELESKIEDLELQLLESGGDDGAEWREEREDIRTRVEKLVDHLGELLAE